MGPKNSEKKVSDRDRRGLEAALIGSAIESFISKQRRKKADIARELGVTAPTLYRWCDGTQLASREIVRDLEELLGLEVGTIAAAAGYSTLFTTVRSAILTDADLDETSRRILLAAYEAARGQHPSQPAKAADVASSS